MPTYDYQCKTCSHTYSAMHKISEAPPACPECDSSDLKKLLSAPAVLGKASARPAADPSCATPAYQGGGCGSGMCGHKH